MDPPDSRSLDEIEFPARHDPSADRVQQKVNARSRISARGFSPGIANPIVEILVPILDFKFKI